MTPKTKAAVGLLALAAAAAVAVWTRLPAEPRYDFRPVARPTALDSWTPPWPSPAEPAASGGVAVAPPRRWIAMGWDGADWAIVLPLVEAGRLPNLARLMREGAYGELRTFVPTQSAAVWTSVATGVSPARHGVEGFAKRPAGLWARLQGALGRKGPARLYSNADRRAKALWNLASEAGRKVLVVGYHNTFPAEKVEGAMVSNYVVRQGMRHAIPGAAADAPGSVAAHLAYPPGVLRRIASLNQRLEDVTWDEIRRFADVDPERFRAKMNRHRRNARADARWDYLLKAYAYDEFHARVALTLRDEVRPDFLLLHFQGPDWAAHHFLYYHWPERYAAMPRVAELRAKLDREAALYRKTVVAFYEHADAWLGKLLEGQDLTTTGVLVLSDHGMDLQDYHRETGFHNDAPAGIVVMAGPGIRRGHRIAGAGAYDVLPTLAASAGLPVARDLDGRVLAEAFEAGAVGPDRITTVASYEAGGRYVPDVPLGVEFQQQMEEELRGLGYIQ